MTYTLTTTLCARLCRFHLFVLILSLSLDITYTIHTQPPSYLPAEPGQVFVPIFKEYVIQLNITAYSYHKSKFCGCRRAQFCTDCWQLMSCGMEALDHLLEECCGFVHRLWVYSGDGGAYCWICDESAVYMDNDTRDTLTDSLIFHYCSPPMFGLFRGESWDKGCVYDLQDPDPVLNLDSELYRICETHFVRIYCTCEVSSKMNMFASRARWSRLIDLLDDDDAKSAISTIIETTSSFNGGAEQQGADLWNQIKETLKGMERENYIPFIVYSFVYPRFNPWVSRGMRTHHPCPFSVHPKTRNILAPIDRYDYFPVDDCPNVRELRKGNKKAVEQWRRATKCFEAHVDKLRMTKPTPK